MRRLWPFPGLAVLAVGAAVAHTPLASPPAELIRRLPAAEAHQGVAVDARHFYAVTNGEIGRYDKRTGAKTGHWKGEEGRFPHLNSCTVIRRELVCAASNYPQTPMTSAVEFLDPRSMRHLRTVALGRQVGSLTWVDRKDGAWWAAFANYDGRGGEPGRDHRDTSLVKFDDQWRRLGAWSFPASALARFAPSSTSGGGFGPDGLLYVTGHDHAELYVLRLPQGGSVLDHVATLAAPIEGQAIAWDKTEPRVLYGVNRSSREVVVMRIPHVPAR